jgi:hypothetical protein
MIVLAISVDINLLNLRNTCIYKGFYFREQLNRSLELRNNVEKKIKKAKATPTTNPTLKYQISSMW